MIFGIDYAKLRKEAMKEIARGEQYKEKGSKFLGFFAQVESVAEFKQFMELVKKEHKSASHYCYAYIIDEKAAGDQLSIFDDRIHKEKYSNDGEPSGCGNALLDLLKRGNRENCAVIVVRYFGGVLLGSGNLIRAYATAGKNVIC